MKGFDHLLRADIRGMEPYTPIVPFEVLSARLSRAPDPPSGSSFDTASKRTRRIRADETRAKQGIRTFDPSR